MGANPLFAGGTFNVFEAGSGEAAANTQGGTVVGSVKYNPDINANIDEQSTLVLNLDFLNDSTQLDVVSVNKDGSGVSYSATSASMDVLSIAVSNGVMLGSFNHNGKIYKFKPAGNGDTLIVETDDVADKTVAAPVVGNGGGASLGGEASASMGCDDDGNKIDVVVAYTPEFVNEVGGEGNVDAYMLQLEQETNFSFQLSGVNTEVDIVDKLASTQADSTNFKKDWNYYKTDGFGSGQALRDLRESKYADIMVVLTGNMGYDACGMAPVNADSGNALAIVREGCGTGYYQFAHDIGHIFGTNHNIDTTQAPGTNEGYAHGYCGNDWRSMMSFNCTSGGGKRKQIWSSPGNTYNGEATGVAGESNNVKVLNDNAKRVDDFMCAPFVPEKVTGLKPVGTIVSNTTPFHYEWKPSGSATEYTVKVTDSDGHVFEKSYTSSAAHCTDDGCSVLSEQMPADGIVKWTVTPQNADEVAGPMSDEATFTVTPLPVAPEAVTTQSPSGLVSTPRPEVKWDAISNATEYLLTMYYVENGALAGHLYWGWISKDDAHCSSGTGTCSIGLPVDLPAGQKIRWWMRARNDAGTSPWNTFKDVTYF
jgi:hypothetical protein